MKTTIKIFSLFLMLSIGTWVTSQKASAQDASVSFQVFYDGLSPYGQWIDYPGQGYVWIPAAGNFQPYSSSGHWAYTDEGWTWVSDYPWGWAPFHYGRWNYDDGYGWMWTPGEEWGCAWVDWRTCNGYYGWAPIGSGNGDIDAARWNFVDEHHMGDQNISRYYSPQSENTSFINRSRAINRSGPTKEAIEKSTGHSITTVAIKSNGSPGQSVKGNELSIYRPKVSKSTSAQPKPVPAKVANAKDLPKQVADKPNIATPSQKTSQHPEQTVQQHATQPVRQQPVAQQPRQRPIKKQPVTKPAKQQSVQQHVSQPATQQSAKKQHPTQSPRQQPAQQHPTQSARQQPAQQHAAQPARQQPAQEQHASPPVSQQPAQEQHSQPANNGGEEHPH